MRRASDQPGPRARRAGMRVLIACTLIITTLAAAQTVLRPVEQGIEDRTATSSSQRIVQRDLRSPAGFDRLYRIEGTVTDPSWIRAGVKPGMYARVQGGVVAIFPQSTYRQLSRGRLLVEVPASTKFLFGDTRGMLGLSPMAPSQTLTEPLLRPLDQRVDMTAGIEPAAQPTPLGPPSIWTDESYRRVRLATILRRPR